MLSSDSCADNNAKPHTLEAQTVGICGSVHLCVIMPMSEAQLAVCVVYAFMLVALRRRSSWFLVY